jgi:L-rhamnose isomerase
MSEPIETSYAAARARYRALGVDADAALAKLDRIPISMHCWQGDDVGGFEADAGGASGGILATGNYPGRATTPAELRADLDRAFALIPGPKRLNLHAIYADTGGVPVDRDRLELKHFQSWIDWAKKQGIGLDFNPTFFGHPLAADGFTLSHPDAKIRRFWIDHGKACRRIAAGIGRELGTPCVMNIWVPDGFKDTPVDRCGARRRLAASLDAMRQDPFDRLQLLEAVESKLFGIGAESCTVGSGEFYLGYALKHDLLLCLDAGHFHPTEVISDKISSVLLYLDEILLHVSRPVRWDSDHVVILDDELQAIAQEIVRNGFERRVHLGLDFFDATINRVAAWVVGARNMEKALLKALLEPTAQLREFEEKFDHTARLVWLEELKTLPFGAVWDYYCRSRGVPVGFDWLDDVRAYERAVQFKRDERG